MSKETEQYWLQRKNSKGDWITMTDGNGNLYRFLTIDDATASKALWSYDGETGMTDMFRVVIRGTSEVVG